MTDRERRLRELARKHCGAHGTHLEGEVSCYCHLIRRALRELADEMEQAEQKLREDWFVDHWDLVRRAEAAEDALAYACDRANEAFREHLNQHHNPAKMEGPSVGNMISRLGQAIGASSVRIRELEADRERLDWLEEHPGVPGYTWASELWFLNVPDGGVMEDGRWATLREAIDAARAEEERLEKDRIAQHLSDEDVARAEEDGNG